MNSRRLENYLKAYRKKTGLTQREVSFLLGWKAGEQLSRYERRHRLPPLRTALACEAIFRIPVAELFLQASASLLIEILQRGSERSSPTFKKRAAVENNCGSPLES